PFAGLNLSAAAGDDLAAVARNRQLVAAACGLGPAGMAWMHQVHGSAVSRMTAGQEAPTADAIFTDVPGLALGVLVADPGGRLAGPAHAGREGMAAGVVPALVAALARAGAQAGQMHAVIGPAI